MKSTKKMIERQHRIGEIFRRLMKEGFDAQTAIKVALEETREN
jgi:hypothetical protein